MNARTRHVVAAGASIAGFVAAAGVLAGGVGATAVPSVTGIWRGYEPKSSTTPVWTFVLHNKPGSTRVTGTWAQFKILGTVSPSTGKAKLVAGVQPGVTVTTDFYVTFNFKSKSTAKTNHPTFVGTYDYVDAATGQQHGTTTGTVRAIRCTIQTNALALGACGG